MDIQLGHYPQVILLVLTRITAVMATVPFYGAPKVSPKLRVAMALMIAIVVVPGISGEWVEAARRIRTVPEMFTAVLAEVMVGALIGLICNAFVGACVLAGTIVGRGSSLMMAQSLDPTSGASSAIMAQIMRMIFILLVLLMNGHLVLVKLVASSFVTLSTPIHWAGMDGFGLVLDAGSKMFQWGLRLALPVLCVSLILQVALSLMVRMAPAFNVLFLSLPIRLGTGLVVFGLTLRLGAGLFERMTAEMIERCGLVLSG